MSDPRTYQIPTETVIECESCSWPNTVDEWDDLRTGEWSYEFECESCGKGNTDHGNALDRGAADVLFVLLITGAALFVVGVLGGSWPLILGGVWLAAVILVIATFMGAKQQKDRTND